MAKSWEITRVWIQITAAINTYEDANERSLIAWDTWIQPLGGEKGWEEATALASQGWELVSSVPIISGHEKRLGNFGVGSSFTEGYWLIFKREKEE